MIEPVYSPSPARYDSMEYRRRGQTLARMSLAWLLQDPRVTSVIIGASSVAQLEDNLKSLENTSFTPDELSRIEELSAPVQLHEVK